MGQLFLIFVLGTLLVSIVYATFHIFYKEIGFLIGTTLFVLCVVIGFPFLMFNKLRGKV